jgi:hypothetical protein
MWILHPFSALQHVLQLYPFLSDYKIVILLLHGAKFCHNYMLDKKLGTTYLFEI